MLNKPLPTTWTDVIGEQTEDTLTLALLADVDTSLYLQAEIASTLRAIAGILEAIHYNHLGDERVV